MDDQAATELKLYIDNDAALRRQQHVPIWKNLATKKVRSQYKHDLAAKLFGYLVEAGAKKYAQEFGSPGQSWHQMFPVPTRKAAAEALTRDFESEFELGNYDHLLPKKYQKEMMGVGGKVRFPSKGHATKKKPSWRVPEGMEVAWSPANQAYFALWPAKAPRREQQVLKIADANEMHGWLRVTYGGAYGRAGAQRASHSRRKTSLDLHTQLHEPGALRAASDRQLRGFFRDEKRDVEAARAEARRRGFELHARKKPPSQLDREIADLVPSWRGGRR